MKKLIIALALFGITGCSQVQNEVQKSFAEAGRGDFVITVYSDGIPVRVYKIKDSIVSSEKVTDGWYFFVNGKLIRVSGTIVIEQL